VARCHVARLYINGINVHQSFLLSRPTLSKNLMKFASKFWIMTLSARQTDDKRPSRLCSALLVAVDDWKLTYLMNVITCTVISKHPARSASSLLCGARAEIQNSASYEFCRATS